MSGSVPPGPPADPATHGAIARTFFLLRMVRLGATVLVCLAVVAATVAVHAPWWVPVLAGGLAVLSALAMWRTRRRWRDAQPLFSP